MNEAATLVHRLDEVASVDRGIHRRTRAWGVLAIGLFGVMALLAIDATYGLSSAGTDVMDLAPSVRIGVLAGLVVLLIVAWMAWRLPSRLTRASRSAYAAWVEAKLNVSGNRLANAVSMAHRDDAFREALVQRSVTAAQSVAKEATSDRLFDQSRLRRARLLGVAAVVLVAIVCSVSPRLFATVALRFVDPFGDHPPLGRFALSVEVNPELVAIGDDVRVTVSADQGDLLAGDLVTIDTAGNSIERLALVGSSGQLVTTLRAVRSRTTFVIETHGCRSHRHVIQPLNLPRIVGLNVYQGDAGLELQADSVVAEVGSEIRIHVLSNRSDAEVDSPDADGLSLTVTVANAPQVVELNLRTPDGLASRRSRRIAILPRRDGRVANSDEQVTGTEIEAASPHGGSVNVPDNAIRPSRPGDRPGSDDGKPTAREGGMLSNQTDETSQADQANAAAKSGSGSGDGGFRTEGGREGSGFRAGVHSGGQPSGVGESVERGVESDIVAADRRLLFEQMTAEQRSSYDELAKQLDASPEAYRDLNAAYFRRIAVDAQRGLRDE